MKHKIVIETDGGVQGTRIYIDGKGQSNLNRFSISLNAGDDLVKMSIIKSVKNPVSKTVCKLINFSFGNGDIVVTKNKK